MSEVQATTATATATGPQAKRPFLPAMALGARGRCPACGKGALFAGFLGIRDTCDACGADLHHHRAHDAPAYFTMFIAGHAIIPPLLAYEVAFRPPLWQHIAIFGTAVTLLSLALLRPIKGAIVGLQWSQYMHGFEDAPGLRAPASASLTLGGPAIVSGATLDRSESLQHGKARNPEDQARE